MKAFTVGDLQYTMKEQKEMGMSREEILTAFKNQKTHAWEGIRVTQTPYPHVEVGHATQFPLGNRDFAGANQLDEVSVITTKSKGTKLGVKCRRPDNRAIVHFKIQKFYSYCYQGEVLWSPPRPCRNRGKQENCSHSFPHLFHCGCGVEAFEAIHPDEGEEIRPLREDSEIISESGSGHALVVLQPGEKVWVKATSLRFQKPDHVVEWDGKELRVSDG
jgi:hypothetical protein